MYIPLNEFVINMFAFQGSARLFISAPASRLALGPIQPPIQWVPGFLSPGLSDWSMKLITHFHLVLRVRMSGTIPPHTHKSSWCGV